jgi:hypothetical protein
VPSLPSSPAVSGSVAAVYSLLGEPSFALLGAHRTPSTYGPLHSGRYLEPLERGSLLVLGQPHASLHARTLCCYTLTVVVCSKVRRVDLVSTKPSVF